MSKKIFAANWKLHKNPTETREFFYQFLKGFKAQNPYNDEIVFFPSAICLESTMQALSGVKIHWGAQNCYFESKGAFTGENSAQVVKDLGGHFMLVGHSERRSLFGEQDTLLAKKIKYLQDLGLRPMFCVGETLAERESGKTVEVVRQQLTEGLRLADTAKPLTVAYEPVWAIGTGKVANSQQVAEAHAEVRKILNTLGWSKETQILYGGSVKPENSKELLGLPEVGGFLVGGASLEVASFSAICGF